PAVPDGVDELLVRPDVRVGPDHGPAYLAGDPGAGADDRPLGMSGHGRAVRDEDPATGRVQVGGEVVTRGTGVEVRAGVLDDGQLTGGLGGPPHRAYQVGRYRFEGGDPGPGEQREAGEPVRAELGPRRRGYAEQPR